MSKPKCEHMNSDGTFKGGFDGCVLHMMDSCGGSHSKESAKRICGSIAAMKATDQKTQNAKLKAQNAEIEDEDETENEDETDQICPECGHERCDYCEEKDGVVTCSECEKPSPEDKWGPSRTGQPEEEACMTTANRGGEESDRLKPGLRAVEADRLKPGLRALESDRLKPGLGALEGVALTARTMTSDLGADGRIMFAPAGDNEISCGCAGKATAQLCIRIDRSTADVLNASLQKLNREFAPQRALFDFEHSGKEAMAWPLAFEWSDSPAPGVYARAEYSSLGKQYVEGKVARAFSGGFFTDADLPKRSEIRAGQTYTVKEGKRGSVENPARIVGLDFPYCGTLTNNPAFQNNLPLWAKHSGGGQEQAEVEQARLNQMMAERLRAQGRSGNRVA